MKQNLFPDDVMRLLPTLNSSEGKKPSQIKIPLKLFSPYSGWTWWLYEYSVKYRIFYGLVSGFEKEVGEVSREELEGAVKMLAGEPLQLIERDEYWDPNTTLLKVATDEEVGWIVRMEDKTYPR